MDTQPSGSRNTITLLSVEVQNKVRLTIRGKEARSKLIGEKDKSLAVLDAHSYTGDSVSMKCYLYNDLEISNGLYPPIFYEEENYEIVIESLDGSQDYEFFHESDTIRNSVDYISPSNRYLLTGILNFHSYVGYSDLIIQKQGCNYLRVRIEVFPKKIEYRKDYEMLIEDIQQEVYNLIFDMLKDTFRVSKTIDTDYQTHTEYFSILRRISDELLNAVDIIIRTPNRMLEAEIEKVAPYKVKRPDKRLLHYLTNHPDSLRVTDHDGIYIQNKVETARKHVTFDTKENRFTKFILLSIIRRLTEIQNIYTINREDENIAFSQFVDTTISQINARINRSFLRNIKEESFYSSMSLVFSMASGYRDLFKYYLELKMGLDMLNELKDEMNISIKNLSTLYEYWCFIKLNSIVRKEYKLKSDGLIKIDTSGVSLKLIKNEDGSQVEYETDNGDTIILQYNQKQDSFTTTQKPDNLFIINKQSSGRNWQYVFDAKYKIKSYCNENNSYIGPEQDDINTMHRYRDAIIAEKNEEAIHTVVGAFVLFPYPGDKDQYKDNLFYKTIEKVNIGAFPFLPGKTELVEEFLGKIINEQPFETARRNPISAGSTIIYSEKMKIHLKDENNTIQKLELEIEKYQSNKKG